MKYRLWRRGTWGPLLLYIALALVFFGRSVNWSDYYFGYSTDSVSFIWFLRWWPFALSHGLNPFICKYVWFPAGYNLTWATSVPLLSLVMWPVTVLGSPVLSYNILSMLAPSLAAWTAFLLARELTGNWVAALVGGFLFGFSAPELVTLLAELNLDTVFLIPLAVLLCVRRLRGSLSRWPFIILLSLVLAAQLGISTEILATLCTFGALTWIIFLLFTPAGQRGIFWRLALDIAIAAPLVVLLTSPFLYYLLKGLPEVPAQINSPYLGTAELLQFVFPSIPIRSAPAEFIAVLKQFTGFTPGNNSYLGFPLLLILIAYFYRNIRAAYVKALLASLCMIALLSLGPRLVFNGTLTNIPMPWMLFSHVPLIRSVMANRLLTYLTLGTAITVAFWLAEAKPLAARLPRFALACLACLFLIPARAQVLPEQWQTQPLFQRQSTIKWTRWPVQPFFTPAHIRAALGPMPNVLLLPDPALGPGMAWQLNAGFGFTQAEGYVGFRPLSQQKWTLLNDIIFGTPGPDFSTSFSAFCAAHKVDYVLIGPGTPPPITNAIEALGWQHHMDEGIEVVKVPGAPPAGRMTPAGSSTHG